MSEVWVDKCILIYLVPYLDWYTKKASLGVLERYGTRLLLLYGHLEICKLRQPIDLLS
jgi:hypothetical protein